MCKIIIFFFKDLYIFFLIFEMVGYSNIHFLYWGTIHLCSGDRFDPVGEIFFFFKIHPHKWCLIFVPRRFFSILPLFEIGPSTFFISICICIFFFKHDTRWLSSTKKKNCAPYSHYVTFFCMHFNHLLYLR